MKSLSKFIIVILALSITTSGCASANKTNSLPPGQISIEDITGTDTIEAAERARAMANSGAGEVLVNRVSQLEKEVKKLTKGQEEIKEQVDSNTERISKLEEYTNNIQKGVDIARQKRGENALPNIEFKENKISGFKTGEHNLSDDMKLKITAMSKFIKDFHKKAKENGNQLRVVIEGWSDGSGNPIYNDQLSRNRATMTRIYLKTLLTPEENIDIFIDIKGMGVSTNSVGKDYRYVVIRLEQV